MIGKRENNFEIRQTRAEKRRKQKELNKENKNKKSISKEMKYPIPNKLSAYKTIEEERGDRIDTIAEQINIMRSQLSALLKKLGKIPDPRNPKTIQHQKTVLMLYGILCFVFQLSSRRAANREMSSPQFYENIKIFFPEIERIPHNDTLKRFLEKIDVKQIEFMHIEMVKKLIRNKKFIKYLINNCYPIAIDGTQKLTTNELWDESLQQRTLKAKEGEDPKIQYYVYVLEANLVFHNGMSIPLASEFLDYTQGDTEAKKQDSETRGFKRLAQRLREYFPKLHIMLLLDGLYANGPVIEVCNNLHWQYMIVLKDDSLPTVWEEANCLIKISPYNHYQQFFGNREQNFWWVNEIEYYYGSNEAKKHILHLVVCEETWEEINDQGQRVAKKSKHAWLSSRPLKKENLHTRCNLAARHRWGIESGLLKEKKQGYHYEHCFSRNKNAMMGYHYLMRMAHLLNELVQFSKTLVKKVKEKTIRGFIQFVFETCKGPWFSQDEIKAKLKDNYRYQLS